MSLPSRNASHTFSQVPSAEIQRSGFDRSHGFKTTFNAGWLIPIYVDEVLPGDTFNLRLNAFARLATPIKPFMDNLFFDTFFFFVPNRLLWDHWEQFNGSQNNPGDSTAYVIPQSVTLRVVIQLVRYRIIWAFLSILCLAQILRATMYFLFVLII